MGGRVYLCVEASLSHGLQRVELYAQDKHCVSLNFIIIVSRTRVQQSTLLPGVTDIGGVRARSENNYRRGATKDDTQDSPGQRTHASK